MIWQPKCWWFFVCFWPPLEQCVTKIWTKQNPKLFPIPIFLIPNPIPIFSDTDTDTNTFVDTNTFFDTKLFQNDNDVSDNCDHNFGTFDDFGVENDQKVSNNMIFGTCMQNWDFFGTKFGLWSHLGPSPKFGTSLEDLQMVLQGVFFSLVPPIPVSLEY